MSNPRRTSTPAHRHPGPVGLGAVGLQGCNEHWECPITTWTTLEFRVHHCYHNATARSLKHTHVNAGAQYNRAAELFEQMQQQGCVPDVVTFTALISAYEKGGQWRRALAAYELMRQQRCKPDAIVYNAIIDALWETGVIWAQRRALTLYQVSLLTHRSLLIMSFAGLQTSLVICASKMKPSPFRVAGKPRKFSTGMILHDRLGPHRPLGRGVFLLRACMSFVLLYICFCCQASTAGLHVARCAAYRLLS